MKYPQRASDIKGLLWSLTDNFSRGHFVYSLCHFLTSDVSQVSACG